jgi:hypothetical protein
VSASCRLAGIVDEQAVFCFNEGSNGLHYAEELDVTVCKEIEDTPNFSICFGRGLVLELLFSQEYLYL